MPPEPLPEPFAKLAHRDVALLATRPLRITRPRYLAKLICLDGCLFLAPAVTSAFHSIADTGVNNS
jgi:hypothetical protein